MNNSAESAGDNIYHNRGESCHIGDISNLSYYGINIPPNTVAESSVTSAPSQLCLCNATDIVCCPDGMDIVPSCLLENNVGLIYPGQTTTLDIIAVGDSIGITPAVIRAFDAHNTVDTGLPQDETKATDVVTISAACSSATFSWLPSDSSFTKEVLLFPTEVCTSEKPLSIRVNFHSSCPLGFELSAETKRCECEERLHIGGITCNISHETIQHTGNVWLGYSNRSGLITHQSPCPFDYCITRQQVAFSLNNTDAQCDHNRSGLLCGRCSEGLSTVFRGTSQCRECSNTHLALLIPFAVAGMALVALLFLLRLTVDYGTLSGLIFYANAAHPFLAGIFPRGQTNILTVFISWINLDLGIETCFYDGMDRYSQTWLQFVFPFYIWTLTALIIFASSHSRRVTKALGSNPVAVLSTLFLLSYLKVFRIIVATVMSTNLEYPGSEERTVWQLDGNLSFESGQYLGLCLFAVAVFIGAIIPYTAFLFFSQLLLSASHVKYLSWMNKRQVKALLDTYHAPYKTRHCYWTGLLLVLRMLIAVVAALTNISTSSTDRTFTVAFSIAAMMLLCLGWGWVVRGVYQHWTLDLLEASFLINLGLLVFASYRIQTNGGNHFIAAYVSVGIAFMEFIGIVFYHSYIVLSQTKCGASAINKIRISLTKIVCKKKKTPDEEEEALVNEDDSGASPRRNSCVTQTVVESVRPVTVWR